MLKSIKKVLIANRSEVVSRINFTCQSLGINTVSVYCEQDQFLPYIYQTDQSYKLSGFGSAAYLNQDEIIEIAIKSGADSIHPGYGFLSENWQFAKKVQDFGLTWIGPEPETIKIMGDKIIAKDLALKSGVPIIPGGYIDSFDFDAAKNLAESIGYPIILKDPWGGGGKGMRKVESSDQLKDLLKTVQSEANTLTGSKQILLEKYINSGRHIEVQIAGDGQNVVHFYERECSIQRRNQKIIEEAGSIFLDKNLLQDIYSASLNLAKSVNYKTIGTVEFMVTADNKFYFLEMNTRLQVEHSVTEFVTGFDFVALQINLAENKSLNFRQTDISKKNHAIECRIYSEDPENNFMPSTGIIKNLSIPNLPYLRLDSNLEQNSEILPYFDPMVAKVTCSGFDRNFAIANMIQVLKNLEISGLKTNIKFLLEILDTKDFLNSNIDTQFISKYLNSKKYPLRGEPVLGEHSRTIRTCMSGEKISDDLNFEFKIAQIAAKIYKDIELKEKRKAKASSLNLWRNQQWN